MTKLLYSKAEAAATLSICERHFETHVQRHVKTVRIGRRVLVPHAELERLVQERAR